MSTPERRSTASWQRRSRRGPPLSKRRTRPSGAAIPVIFRTRTGIYGKLYGIPALRISDMNNLFESLPKDLGTEVFEEIIRSSTVRIERIVSKGHASPATGWYDQ